jgi:hypothetical protein
MRPRKLLRLLACVFFAALPYAAWTQQPCRISPEDMAVEAGDAFVVWLYAAHQDQPGAPDWSLWALAVPPENVLDTGNWTQQGDSSIWVRQVQLIAFDTGQLTFPPIPLPLPPFSMCTLPSWNIHVVHGMYQDSAEHLAAIKDIHRTDDGSRGWHITAVLAALLLVAVGTGYMLLQRKKPYSPQPTWATQPKSVLDELDRLALNTPTAPDQTAAFYAQISYAMRLLIQLETGLPALKTPTKDWVHRLPDSLSTQTQSLLKQCELAKFAKYQPPPDAHSTAIFAAKTIARQILDIPKPEA